MATRKKYTDALSRAEQSAKQLDLFYIEVGKVMLTECPKLGDLSPTKLREIAGQLKDVLARGGKMIHRSADEPSPQNTKTRYPEPGGYEV
ncbi:TPA: hypothetical protein ACJSTK_001919 [Streptococcus agalactiae]|nr:hypothetical protein [Streptococcus anginosus]MED5938335.1 hypothetical protein [Streptococcus anginosus]MED5978599.1 hypothetical protein [Streptococcus anginosus]HEN2947037.1 hypothetical protein [Streptococcus agalactiae]